jgi:hypothetical protein
VGALAFLASNWRTFFYAVIALALAAGGFYLKSRLAKADEADRLTSINYILTKQHDFQQEQIRKTNDANILLSAQVKSFEESTAGDVQTVTKIIKVHVRDQAACDIPVEVLKGLNTARGTP